MLGTSYYPYKTAESPRIERIYKERVLLCCYRTWVKSKLILGIAISMNHPVEETLMFSEAFVQTLSCHPDLKNVLGAGIYGCRWITNLVSENHATPYFIPRSNVTFKSIGDPGWYDMQYLLWEDPHGRL